MNRRQRERVEDLGRAFTQAMEDIIDGEQDRITTERVHECEGAEMTEPVPMPLPVDMNANLVQYDVNIKHVHNGFIVSVGCQTFVFESFDKLSKYMAIYYDDPRGTYEKHYKGELFQ